jgi:hypothetical protein
MVLLQGFHLTVDVEYAPGFLGSLPQNSVFQIYE